ncbi:unnamed protein product [Schistosoma curassoni]|uniref:Uncharacterized protein n=1 Tax=Schistosoma curassoni TaxID=6186 RepID=A0A183L6K9_9TREM|nr:unnamed protein product [Schistosoma curassoni]
MLMLFQLLYQNDQDQVDDLYHQFRHLNHLQLHHQAKRFPTYYMLMSVNIDFQL